MRQADTIHLGGTSCEVIWVHRNPWRRGEQRPVGLATKVWPEFDAQARSPYERLDFLSLQATHPPQAVRTGFLRVLKGQEPVMLLPFFVMHVTLDDAPISTSTKEWLRRLRLPQIARWLNLPLSPIGVQSVFLGGYHNPRSRFHTRSGTHEELADPWVELAVKRAIRKIQWQTGSLRLQFVNFENTLENLRVFDRWGLQIHDAFPSTLVDLETWRKASGNPSEPRDYLNHLDRKRRAYLRKEVLPPLDSGQVTLEEPGIDEVRSLRSSIFRAYLHQRSCKPMPWLAATKAMFDHLVALPMARTRVLWMKKPDGTKEFAAFNIILTHAGDRMNYWYGVNPDFQATEDPQARISTWYSVVYSDILSAIREGVRRLELGQTAYFNKLHMGAELMRLIHASQSLLGKEETPQMTREFLYAF